MSLQQKHLWHLLAMEQNNSLYRTWCKVSVDGSIDIARLRSAIEKAIQRYEILHTVLRSFPGMTIPLQVILPEPLVAFSIHDLSSTPPVDQSERIQSLTHKVLDPAFSLEEGPMLDVKVIKLGEEHHLLLLGVPAFCLDASSMALLVHELSRYYDQGSQRGEPNDELLQYADFAAWQQELFEVEETRTGQHYWLASDRLALLDAPLAPEHLRVHPHFAQQEIELACDPLLLKQAEKLASRLRMPVSLIFQTAWQILLWRLQGKTGVVTGIGSNERKYEELTGAIGVFDQLLPALCKFEDQQSFMEALTHVLEQTREMHRWQEFFSWETIAEHMPGSRTPGEPFVHAAFSWEELISPPNASVSWHIQECRAIADRSVLSLVASKNDDALRLIFSFDANRIERAAVPQLAGQYIALLASALSNPEQAINTLNLLGVQERQQLLTTRNVSDPDEIHSPFVHELFEKYATRHPHARALVIGDRELTYQELNEQANWLAVRLQTSGISTEARVGIYLDRSAEQVIAMLGILKAGGVYVPLDPAWPRARLNLLLQESPLDLVITTHALQTSLPGHEKLSCLYLERVPCIDADGLEAQPVPVTIHPEQLAYVLYTSGSTGVPKGVAVTHANLRAYVSQMLKVVALPENSTYATPAPLGADLGNTAIYAALCDGGCLHLLLQDQANNPRLWASYLREHQIACIKMVPSHLSALLESDQPAAVLPSSCLVLGGETLSWELARKVLELRPDCRLINHYGPTESTVGVLTFEVQAREAMAYRVRSTRTESVPIGSPLPHAQVYVLDEAGEPLPVWQAGEIYIGGRGVTRGYDEKADLTAERFLPDPWSSVAGGRLYRTGDRGRWLPDGTLEFLGRIDRQVKMRGFRVELGEIEASLHKHAGIRECVVEHRKESGGEGRLIAYFIPQDNSQIPDREELNASLRPWLPEYMIPTAFVPLEAFPLTPTGKINRQALPAPNQREQANVDYIPPRTPAEQTLAGIWEEILGIPRISVHANFFALGGDSILSIRIIARAAQAGLILTPKQIFQDQTIADLAAHARQATVLPEDPRAVQEPLSGEVALTPIQHWFFNRQLQKPWHYNQSMLLQMQFPLKAEILEVAARALLEHHDALRLRYQQTSEGWKQRYGPVPASDESLIEQIHLSDVAEQEQTAMLTHHAERVQGSLRLETGPLLRIVLFNLGVEQPQRLLLVIHHLAIDGVSWNILLEDLKSAYAQLERGEHVRLPAKTSSYQQWSDHLQRYAHSQEIEEQIPYWIDHLRMAGMTSNHETEASEQDANSWGSLDDGETRALLTEVPPIYQTRINEVLLTALSRTLASWRGKSVVRIDMESHGREEIGETLDVSRTVGWFTSLYPVLLEAREHEDIEQALKRVKEQVRSIPQGGLGYGVLSYLRQDEETRELRAHPWNLLRLNYLGQMDQAFQQQEWWQVAPEDSGPQQGNGEKRPYQLEVNALTAQGRFQVKWNYQAFAFEKETIEELNRKFLNELRAIIAHCRQPGAGGYTPSDFPDVTLSQNDLDELFAELGSETGSENEWL